VAEDLDAAAAVSPADAAVVDAVADLAACAAGFALSAARVAYLLTGFGVACAPPLGAAVFELAVALRLAASPPPLRPGLASTRLVEDATLADLALVGLPVLPEALAYLPSYFGAGALGFEPD